MKGYYEHTSTSLAKGQARPICHLLSFRIPPLIIGLSAYDVSSKLPTGPPEKRPQAAGKTTVDPEVILPRARCEPMCGLISVTLFGLYQMKRVRTERDERTSYPLLHY